ncbi:MAG: hypothetical protein KBA95_11770 [Acidobacteria bacterium]|nr:hypothetical protein [Acidobacteriota bacterium]
MRLGWTGRCGLAFLAILLVSPAARADRWDVLREIGEGDREIRRERREAVREILRADSGWEVARELGEGAREIRREKREKRREVRREIRDELFRR